MLGPYIKFKVIFWPICSNPVYNANYCNKHVSTFRSVVRVVSVSGHVRLKNELAPGFNLIYCCFYFYFTEQLL